MKGQSPQTIGGTGTFEPIGAFTLTPTANVTLNANLIINGSSTSSNNGVLNLQNKTISGTGAFRTVYAVPTTSAIASGVVGSYTITFDPTIYGSAANTAGVANGLLITGNGIPANTFIIGTDPLEGAGTVLSSNIKVFVNNELTEFVKDYIYNGPTKQLIITKTLAEGDAIKIENDFRAEYTISTDSTVTLLTLNNTLPMLTTNETNNDIVKITWFSEYPSMEIVSDEFVGGKINYQLGFTPLDASYVWVFKNGERLVQDREFYVSLPRGVVYLTESTTIADTIKIVIFGSKIYRAPSAYEIHKDMLNGYSFKRYSVDSKVTLSKELTYYDQEIVVTDATTLSEPIRERNIPGTLLINNERIEYLQKTVTINP
jgi:hypothetical protein